MNEATTISSAALRNMLADGQDVTLIDVRTPGEFAAVHVHGARLHPLEALDLQAVRRDAAEGRQVYVICESGGRSRQAQAKLAEAGVAAVVIEGGTTACDAAGVPMVRGRGPIPLQRQAMIGAGIVIWLGLLLGWLVSPWFLLIVAFAGCGLIAAGALNICLMAMLLARLPWNRQRGGAACGTSCAA